METPTPIEAARKSRAALIWIILGTVISLIALCRIAYALRVFYYDTASLAPGTPVRPMDVTFHLGVAATASILFGSTCGFIGVFVAICRRQRLLTLFALLTMIIAWIPLWASSWGYNYVITLRKLVLEP